MTIQNKCSSLAARFLAFLIVLLMLLLTSALSAGLFAQPRSLSIAPNQTALETPIFDTVTSYDAEIIQLLAGDLDGDNNADIVFAPIMTSGLYVG